LCCVKSCLAGRDTIGHPRRAAGRGQEAQLRDAFVKRNEGADPAQLVGWRGRWLCLRTLHVRDAARYAEFHALLDSTRVDGKTLALLPDCAAVAAGAIDRDRRRITFAAILDDKPGTILGVACAVREKDEKVAHVAIALRPNVEGQGLGRLLVGKLVTDCRQTDLLELTGETHAGNQRMLDLARAFRFVETPAAAPGFVSLRLPLRQPMQD
jgi:GNAT superfamily N-acetyltransferase